MNPSISQVTVCSGLFEADFSTAELGKRGVDLPFYSSDSSICTAASLATQ